MCEAVPGPYLTALKNIYMRRIPCMLWKVLVPVPEESVAAFKAAEANRQSTYRASIKQVVEPVKQALARAMARNFQHSEAKPIQMAHEVQHANAMAALAVASYAPPSHSTHLGHPAHLQMVAAQPPPPQMVHAPMVMRGAKRPRKTEVPIHRENVVRSLQQRMVQPRKSS